MNVGSHYIAQNIQSLSKLHSHFHIIIKLSINSQCVP